MDSLTPAPTPCDWRPLTPGERVMLKLMSAGWDGELLRKNESGEIVSYTFECVENQPENEVE